MNELLELIYRSLRLDLSLWTELRADPQALRFRGIFVIVLLAGLSDGIAQSVVLFFESGKATPFCL